MIWKDKIVRLPEFDYIEPGNLEEALKVLADYGTQCKILAGGTDLLVRMKQRLILPDRLVSLKKLHELDTIQRNKDSVIIGARTCLHDICRSTLIQKEFNALHQAVDAVGAPSIQHYTGTIGGNILQDTRCLFYNQSVFWRSGKHPCHKAGGQTCYARDASDRCHGTYQSDGGTALVALDARITLKKNGAQRTLPLIDLFTSIGDAPFAMEAGELLTEIEIPIGPSGTGSAYQRLAYRSAIDYPIVCAGVLIQCTQNLISRARIVVGAVGRAPLYLSNPSQALVGMKIDDAQALKAAAMASMNAASAFAVNNVGASVEYRTQMIAVIVERALYNAAQNAQASQRNK